MTCGANKGINFNLQAAAVLGDVPEDPPLSLQFGRMTRWTHHCGSNLRRKSAVHWAGSGSYTVTIVTMGGWEQTT